jgi:hypothetical protein
VFLKAAQNMLSIERNILLYCNFSVHTNVAARELVCKLFKDQTFVVCDEPFLPYGKYFERLVHSKFVLSPFGTGLDCHRTWESLYLGSFPIVKTSTLDALYVGLPVIIVNDWREITREFLEHKYLEMKGRTYTMEKLYMNYWIELIQSYQKQCRKNIKTLR